MHNSVTLFCCCNYSFCVTRHIRFRFILQQNKCKSLSLFLFNNISLQLMQSKQITLGKCERFVVNRIHLIHLCRKLYNCAKCKHTLVLLLKTENFSIYTFLLALLMHDVDACRCLLIKIGIII